MKNSTWKTLCKSTELADGWLSWLSNAGSMTQALEKASGQQMQVIVQKEGWQVPSPNELEILDLGANPYWVREVILVTGEPVMFARSVFPKKLVDHFPQLMSIGHHPLGHTLFGSENFTRGDIEIAEIMAGNSLWEQMPVMLRSEKHWARRSLFHSAVSPLLLSEVFLPYVTTL